MRCQIDGEDGGEKKLLDGKRKKQLSEANQWKETKVV
jgi:hypothetical protein